MRKKGYNIAAVVLTFFTLALLLIPSLYSLTPGFTVLSSGRDFVEVEFQLPDYEMVTVDIDGVKYQRLLHPYAGFLMEEGLPEVIAFSTLLAIPDKGTVSLELPTIKEMEIMPKTLLFPSQGFDLEVNPEIGFLKDEQFYGKDIDYPQGIALVNSPAIMRYMRLVTLTLNPFSYNPSREELTVRKRMVVRLNFNIDEEGENEIVNAPRRLSRSFENLFERNVLNHSQFRNNGTRQEYQPQTILVVHNFSTTIQNTVDQYVNWKRDKGFRVTAVSTQGMTTAAALQQYIQNAYNNWQYPPEFIVLIGSGFNESLPVPYALSNNIRGDYPYTLLAGNDDLPDAFIGRISAADANGVATAWNKIRNYERTPFMGDLNWYEHGMVVGDTAGGYTGISAVIMAKLVKELMKTHKSDYAVTEVLDAPFPARMDQAINQGVAYYSFRGAVGFAGWSPNEGALNNGFKLSNSTFLTCGTLDFEGARRSEQFVRMGTPTVAKGGITSVGMTTNSTTTAFNNVMTGGIAHSIYIGGTRTMGEALVDGKLALYVVYGNMHAGQLPRFTQQTNLIGDPTLSIWGSKPQTLNVSYPEALPVGSNSIVLTVTGAGDVPIKNAWVTIRQEVENGVYATGYTDNEGKITHFFEPTHTGEVRVTVTKNDHKPFLGNFNISGTQAVGLNSVVYNNALVAGNQVNFALVLRNFRAQQANGVTATISSTSPYVTVTTANANFGNIAPNATAESATDYVVQLAHDAPTGHKAILQISVSDNAQNNWMSRTTLVIQNGSLEPVSIVILDDGNGILDPLEVADIKVNLRNVGETNLTGIQGILRGDAYGLSIVDSIAVYGNINVNQTVGSTNNHFTVSTTAYVIPGTNYDLELYLYNDQGFSQTRMIKLQVGQVRVTDPLGPDQHGYWIYDVGDVGYVDSAVYEWIEIAPALGGQGVNTGLVTDHDNDQRVMTMDLPFTFKFYGVDYNTISICPNGWLSPGRSEQAAFRNGRLPGVLGPNPIIAPFWENLSLAQGGVFTYYDAEQHIFIVQWQNALNVMQNAPNTFQVILYDPVYYYTTTFDGPIKFQYKVFANTNNGANNPGGLGNWGNYATIGIGDHTSKIGLEYTYNNRYPTAARPVTNETALYITTGLNSALVGVDSFWVTDGNNNIPEYGETFNVGLRLTNIGVEDAPGVSVRASTNDQYLTILQNNAEFGDIEEGTSVTVQNALTMQLSDDVPHRHRSIVNLVVTTTDNLVWNYDLNIDANAPLLTTLTPIIYDPAPHGNNNGMVDPGEQLLLYLPIINDGGSNSPPVDITVTSQSPLVTINNVSEPRLNYIKTKEIQYPAVNITISNEATTGAGIRFNYSFISGNYAFEGTFLVGVGGIIPIQLGSGEAATNVNAASPINIYFRSSRTQTVYLATDLQEHGVFGEFPINQIGYYIVSAPQHPLVNFIVRMKHTDAGNVENHDNGPFTTVYTNPAYMPVANDWHMMTLDPPFIWNGTDNILVDTGFAPVQGWSNTGQVRVNNVPNCFRFTRADSPDQTNLPTTTVSTDKPQLMMMMGVDPESIVKGPRDLEADLVGGAVRLTWQPPQDNRGAAIGNDESRRRSRSIRDDMSNRNPDGYNVYRNGIKLNENPLEELLFDDTEFDSSVLCYYFVTALYGDDETLPSNIVVKDFDRVAKPQFEPANFIQYGPFMVSIASTTPEAQIFYTVNGEEPTTDDTLYQEPFELIYNTSLKARAFRENWVASDIATINYKVLYQPENVSGTGTTNSVTVMWDNPWAPDDRLTERRTRTASRNSINVNNNRNVVLGYNVYRSTDGEDFTQINPELITRNQYLDGHLERAIYYYYVTAMYEYGESNPSDIVPVGVGYVTKPVFRPLPGEYNNQVSLRLSCNTNESVIFYTLDGQNPNESSSVYTGSPIVLTRTTTVKTYAIRTDWVDSEISVGEYIITTTSVDEDEMTPILRTELLAAYPNPFNPSTTIEFNLKEEQKVTLEIYNILGKKVHTLLDDSPMNSGNHHILWNGEDHSGRKVSSGVYFYRMSTDSNYSAVRKIVMLK